MNEPRPMPINLRAMAVSVGISIILAVILIVIGGALLFASAMGMLGGLGPENIILSMGAFGVTFVCVCCGAVIMCALDGALYAALAHRFGSPIHVGYMAMGGAICTQISATIMQGSAGLYAVIDNIIKGTPVDEYGAALAQSLIVGICAYSVIYLGLGAAGGALYAVIAKRRQPTTDTVPV